MTSNIPRRLCAGVPLVTQAKTRPKKLCVTERIFLKDRVVNTEAETAQKVVSRLNKTWKNLYGPLIGAAGKRQESKAPRAAVCVRETGFKNLPPDEDFSTPIRLVADRAELLHRKSRSKEAVEKG